MIELTVAVGLLGIIAMGSMSQIVNLVVNQSTFNYRVNVESMADQIRKAMLDPQNCTNTLRNMTLEPGETTNIPVIRDASDNVLYATNSLYEGQSVRIRSMVAKNYSELSGDNGQLILEVVLESSQRVNGSQTMSRNVVIKTTRTGSVLSECNSQQLTSQTPWQDTGIGSNIYVTRNVGIGTSDPAAMLDVKNGKLRGQLDCRNVSAEAMGVRAVAMCAADEYVIGGGGACPNPFNANGGFIFQSDPTDDLDGWIVDCSDDAPTLADSSRVHRTSNAICCKR